MAVENVFEKSKCLIEPVASIPDGGWFADTAIPEAPADINDCPGMTLALIPPSPLCPDMAQVVTGSVTTVPPGDEGATVTITQLPNCAFDFDLDIAYPCGPQIVGTYPVVPVSPINVAYPGHGELAITTVDNCLFDFALDIGFPCPTSLAGTHHAGVALVPAVDAGATLTITVGDDCAFDLDFDIKFPLSDAACPNLAGVYEARTTFSHSPVSKHATLIITQSDECVFDFFLDIGFPCPKIQVKKPKVRLVSADKQKVVLTIDERLDDRSDISDVSLGSDVSLEGLPESPYGISDTSDSQQDEFGDCTFDINLAIDFPSAGFCAFSEAGGIPAMISTTPGWGYAQLCLFNGISIVIIRRIKVWNNMTHAIGGLRALQIMIIDGYPFVSAEDCP